MSPNDNNNAALIAHMKETVGAETKTLSVPTPGSTGVAMLVPNGMSLVSVKKHIDEWRLRPERRKGTASFVRSESFIEHVNLYKSPSTLIFGAEGDLAAAKLPTLTAVLNYQAPGDDGVPEYGDHRSIFSFPLTEEWKKWMGQNKVSMSQGDFAVFLEDSIVDVQPAPDMRAKGIDEAVRMLADAGGRFGSAMDLLMLSKGLTIRANSVTTEVINLGSGEVELRYGDAHTDEKGKPLKIPTLFTIAIPIFKGGPAWKIFGRLRYRLGGGKVTWWYDLYRPDRRFDEAFAEVCTNVADKTKLPVLLGSPENYASKD